jgi:hypothetical protein
MSLRNSECLGFSATIIGAKVFMMAAANNSAEKKNGVVHRKCVFTTIYHNCVATA